MLALLWGRRLRWYAIFFAAFSFAIVYPDVVAGWIAACRNSSYTRRLVAAVFGSGVVSLVLFTIVAQAVDDRVVWWTSCLGVGLFAGIRLITTFTLMIFGLDRDP